MLDGFLRDEVARIAARSLAGIGTREAWEANRHRLRRELKEMLGLDPEPPRGDLRAATTGVIERPDLGIAVEKVHFQPVPGLYVTGSFHRPLRTEGRIPAVLYLCGHGQVKVDGVSFGNKALYQHHPAWFARNGFACLVIDTLQLGEIEGKHHGTYRLDMWWWVSRGYTPAGIEAWSSIRAIDFLEARPEVDPGRIGVTGRSGGGIGSWWLAALDDRPAAFVPVAGITDLENHVVDGCIDGHCDCNYPVNLYQWDYPAVAALAAPRPVLLANSDKDSIFPLGGVLRVHAKLRSLYDLLGAGERLGLTITEGPHKDTQPLQVPAFLWMERWLKGAAPDARVRLDAEKPFDPKDLKVLAEVPRDERNTSIEESFVPARAAPEVPADLAGFETLRSDLLGALRARTFRNMPDPAGAPLRVEQFGAAARGGLRLRGYRFDAEGPFRLPLWVVSGERHARPSTAVLRVVDSAGWAGWISAAAASFAAELGVDPASADPERAAALASLLEKEPLAIAVLAPRGIGPTRFAPDAKAENQVRRRFLAIGRTLEEAWILDARRALRVLESAADLAGARLRVEGERRMAEVALYAGILEPRVERLDLAGLAPSHRSGIPLLNVLRVLDIPQAAALVFPRVLVLRGVEEEAFAWTRRAALLFPPGEGGNPLVFAEEEAGPERGR
jgi:dienelactone hydrolase